MFGRLEMGVMRWAILVLMVMAGLPQNVVPVAGPKTLTVGGDNSWTFPPNGVATFFNDWAKQNVFYVGDSLFFNYQYDYHDVLEVSQADVASCSAANPIETYTQANATVTLDRTGYYGFICGLPSHCEGNMKLELTVLAVGTPVPSPVSPPATPSAGIGAASGPSSSPASGPGAAQTGTNGGASVRSGPAVILAALFAGCFAVFL